MKTGEMFLEELILFSKKNWWVYIIYVLMIISIFIINSDILGTVIFSSTCHFIADIFIMMMITAYSQNRFKMGSCFQVTSMLIFLAIKLWTGIHSRDWHYLTTDLIYALAAYKNFQLDVYKREIKIIGPVSLFILSLVIICGVVIPLNIYLEITIFSNIWQIIQTIGIFLFAYALSYTGKEKNRYFFSVISLFVMVFGSVILTANTLFMEKDQLTGLELSYALLPLTVLVFYLGKWNNYIKPAQA